MSNARARRCSAASVGVWLPDSHPVLPCPDEGGQVALPPAVLFDDGRQTVRAVADFGTERMSEWNNCHRARQLESPLCRLPG